MKPSHKTISFYTLGCRLNQSETEILEQIFSASPHYQIKSFDEPCDIYVINTCTVTEKSDLDTRKLVHKISRLNPQAKIALIGCQSQTQKEKLAKFPHVHWVVGNEKKMDLLTILKGQPAEQPVNIITPTILKNDFSLPISDSMHGRTRAHIKIQDGCNFFCSYCEVPYARGRARSRVFDNILKEADSLVKAGHKEIIITGINAGTYHQNNYKFIDVINALEQISGLERIRISSIEFTTIPEEILRKMAAQSKLCRFLHVPLQSGADPILKSMNRKYTFKEYNSFLQKAYAMVPGICLGTDIIVGFPGETDKYFIQTADRLKKLPIHYLHVFSYSKRPFAKSRLLSGENPLSTIQKRSQILRELSKEKRATFHHSLIGSTQNVLFEQKKGDYWFGFTDNYVRVKVSSNLQLSNQILPVKLEKEFDQIILGKLLN
ncbi:MAG: tRNA (N(6)-L-threonylcarbamoyladenosine(37)-C(2))-methylthiotransferase MtaB [Candidatus Omnitrophica bacterium]|nr:tRNA (N(6)-L-threonylcarbamoyladenosine(37)-C(2))-methylthiotransferase MtaB [Candidatus Omnitrophota bacterium]